LGGDSAQKVRSKLMFYTKKKKGKAERRPWGPREVCAKGREEGLGENDTNKELPENRKRERNAAKKHCRRTGKTRDPRRKKRSRRKKRKEWGGGGL